MKKFVSILLILSMVFVISTSSFALQSIDIGQNVANYNAKIVEKVIGTSKIDKNIKENTKYYSIDLGDVDYIIPRSGDEVISFKGEAFGIIKKTLPKDFSDIKSVQTSNGTIVYNSNRSSMALSVQVIEEPVDFSYIQSTVILKDFSAPKSFSYQYNLPEGYQLVRDSEYGLESGKQSTGAIFVVNAYNEVINVIELMPAVDANGKKVEADYVLKDTTLSMRIKPDTNTTYPIIVPLVDHPNRIKTTYMTKSEVLDVRNKFKTSTESNAFSYLISVVLSLVKDMSIVGIAWGTVTFMGTQYNSKKFETWDKFYVEFKKNYAKIDATYKWHPGQRSYYPTGSLKCTYVAGKS
ncbi:hypothetical protein ACPW7J_06260 [Ihubacter sp. rT4E-8]|uniref:hypothetical protein n=1 Tax=Ihubacter sp. rT4E-8 TaxID=3242369 RepID=UPI003CF3DA57